MARSRRRGTAAATAAASSGASPTPSRRGGRRSTRSAAAAKEATGENSDHEDTMMMKSDTSGAAASASADEDQTKLKSANKDEEEEEEDVMEGADADVSRDGWSDKHAGADDMQDADSNDEAAEEDERKMPAKSSADINDEDKDDDRSNKSSDSDSESDSSSSSDDEESDDDDDDKEGSDKNDGLSSYERLRLERIKRNNARLAALGLLDVKEQVRQQQKAAAAKKKKKKKKDAKELAPQRILPKRQARSAGLTAEQLHPFDVRKMRVSSNPAYYDRRGGSAGGAAGAAIEDRYRRTYRCGDCAGCRWAEDCGQCVWCVGMKTNPRRQRRCLMKLCRNRLVDTTSSATTTAVAAGTKEGGKDEDNDEHGEEEEEEEVVEEQMAEDSTGGGETKMVTVTMGELIKKNRIKMPRMPSASSPAATTDADATTATGMDGEEKKEDEEEVVDEKLASGAAEEEEASASDQAKSTADDSAAQDDACTPPIVFPESCCVCKEDGILFCCDTCPRGFHSDCHFPKVRDLPVGDWQCVECIRAADGSGNGGSGGGDVPEKPAEVHAVLPAGFDLEEHVSRSGKKRGARSPKRGRKKAPKAAVGGIGDNVDADGNGDASAAPGKTVKVTIHDPRAQCTACKDFGDIDEEPAILCRACDQYYHKDCQELDHKARGRWRCDSCKVAKASVWYDLLAVIPEEGGKEGGEEEDTGIAPAGGKTIRVSVVGPEAKCLECSEDGKGGEDMVWCRACDMSFHLGCHSPPLQTIPRGRWKCGKCKAANIPLPKPKPKVKTKDEILSSLNLFKGEHDDDCYICYNGGDLVCCDFCSKAYHMQCHIPPLPFLPDEGLLWKCCECSATERTRKSRCGECKACLRKPCGKCTHCLNNSTKRVCIKKVCPYPRFAPPASSTSIPGLTNIKIPSDGDDEKALPIKSGGKKRGCESDGGGRGKKIKRKGEVDSDEDDVEMEEESEDEWAGGPITVKIKVNSLKSAFMDPESVKIRKIINSARRNATDSKACDKACEHLRKHLSTTDNLEKIILWRGIEMICDAMREHPDKTIVQAEACCTLAEMIWLDPTIATKLAHEGAIELIATCMNRFATNLKVQQMGCGAFRALTYDETSVHFISDADGLAAVLSSMKNNPTKLLVQREACYFLQNMLVHENQTANAISKSRVVPIIADAMANEHADAEFIQSVCGLIANLALNKRAKTAIGKSGAIPCIIEAVNASEDLDVKQAACSALKHLALESSDNQKRISEAGGLEAVFSAIKAFANDEVLLIAAFGAMKELCIGDEASGRKLVSKGIVKIILRAMEENQDLAIMQSAACGLIGYLPYGKRDKEAPKLAKAVIAAMKAHGDGSYVQIEGCDALVELAHINSVLPILKEKSTQKLLQKAKKEYEECQSDVNDIIAITKKK